MSAARSSKKTNRTAAKGQLRAGRGSAPANPERRPDDSSWRPAQHRHALKWTIVIVLALIAINVIIYLPVRNYDFVELDDPLYIRENPHVAGGLTWEGVVWAFTNAHASYWIPLTWLSYMIDVQVNGMNPGPPHVTNVILHIANTILLFMVLMRMTGALGRSAFVAGLFAAHPLHVESVAWLTERKDVLSTLFWLLVLWVYAGYVRKPGWSRYLIMSLLFVLGLMVKPMLVTLPFTLLLLDVWPLRRAEIGSHVTAQAGPVPPRDQRSGLLGLVWEKLPLLAVTVVASVVAFLAQKRGGAVSGLDVYPLGLRLENALISYVAYIGKMLWPSGLAAFYPYQASLPGWSVAGSALLLVAISVVAMWLARRHPYVPVGWLWYLGTMVPVIGLVQVGIQAMADRFTYVPLIGLFIIAAWGVPDLLARWSRPRRALPAVAALVILACTIVARSQVQYWKDNITLWTRASEVTLHMDNYRAHLSLGTVLKSQGRLSEAIVHLTEAVHLRPNSAEARHALATALVSQGKTGEAIVHYSEAVRLQPDDAEAHSDLGLALANQGKTDAAITQYSEALRLKPDMAHVHNALGCALAGEKQISEAIIHFSETIRLKPDFAEAHYNLGLALTSQGKLSEAIAHYAEALRLKPDYAEAHNNLGIALAAQGKVGEAIPHFAEVARLKPESESAHVTLGMALAGAGRIDEAIQQFTDALRINPNSQAARLALDKLRSRGRQK